MLQSWTGTMLLTLRKQVEEFLALAKRELSGCKTTGRNLDQAEHRHRQTQQATQHAENSRRRLRKPCSLLRLPLHGPEKTNTMRRKNSIA